MQRVYEASASESHVVHRAATGLAEGFAQFRAMPTDLARHLRASVAAHRVGIAAFVALVILLTPFEAVGWPLRMSWLPLAPIRLGIAPVEDSGRSGERDAGEASPPEAAPQPAAPETITRSIEDLRNAKIRGRPTLTEASVERAVRIVDERRPDTTRRRLRTLVTDHQSGVVVRRRTRPGKSWRRAYRDVAVVEQRSAQR
ncbi:MAG: hypothetical protein HYZ89_00480 [Candidatus Omnitrophica bacterium]|nr:hypothetical protein [Candidatus Omnitrophota bacterium]